MPPRTLVHSTTALATVLLATFAGADVRDPNSGAAIDSPNAVCSTEVNTVCSDEAWRIGIYDGSESLAGASDRSTDQRMRTLKVSSVHYREPLDPGVVQVAQELLDLPLGSEVVRDIEGAVYGFRLEPHYHPPGFVGGPIGWHKGVTLYHVVESEEQ